MYIILIYDISCEYNGEKRLARCYKICKQYLHHIQYSVFEGDISESRLEELKVKLNNIIKSDIDSVIIFNARNEKWLKKTVLGFNKNDVDNFI